MKGFVITIHINNFKTYEFETIYNVILLIYLTIITDNHRGNSVFGEIFMNIKVVFVVHLLYSFTWVVESIDNFSG